MRNPLWSQPTRALFEKEGVSLYRESPFYSETSMLSCQKSILETFEELLNGNNYINCCHPAVLQLTSSGAYLCP